MSKLYELCDLIPMKYHRVAAYFISQLMPVSSLTLICSIFVHRAICIRPCTGRKIEARQVKKC